MTDTAIDYQSFSGSYSVDGSSAVTFSWSPPAGQLWYVEAIRFHTDDSNGTDANAGAFIVRENSTNYDVSDTGNTNGNGGEIKVGDGNNPSDIQQVNLDTFVSDAEEIIIVNKNGSNSNITINWVFHVRRVL